MGIETLAIASLVAGAGSGIMGAVGASTSADANAGAYNYKAQVAANNAIIAKQNADQAISAGGVQAQTNDLKTKNLIATQKVTQAANGLDVNSGTNVDVQQSAADVGHLDTLTILNNATKTARGYKVQGMGFEAESGLNKAAGANAQTAGDIDIAKSLLGGASSVGDKWMSYKSKGVF